jgi:NAD+ synthase (glutamine-hydrolysing)
MASLPISSSRIVKVATCNLNQWALDFHGNLQRIVKSIELAKAQGATYRVGPELEICGYGCEDHFLEIDTITHSWECLAYILSTDLTDNCVCDFGMPLIHEGVRYNCRVVCLDKKVLMIRPKINLANDGNYRERRYFASYNWSPFHPRAMEVFLLPSIVTMATGQTTVPFGVGILAMSDGTTISCEMCEELFVSNSPHAALALNGVEIIGNGSGSHHQLRKLNVRVKLMQTATAKCGGVYLYANQQGCDGGRLYYDGCAMVYMNGDLLGQGTQFSLSDVELVCATIDLDYVTTYRTGLGSRNDQAAKWGKIPRVAVNASMKDMVKAAVSSSGSNEKVRMEFLCRRCTAPTLPRYHTPEEEIGYGPAAWLWDYLRRSGAGGYLLPLSGGADSSATCAIVGIMCKMVVDAMEQGNEIVMEDARRIAQVVAGWTPRDLANKIMHTCFMGTEHSSQATTNRAAKLAGEIGTYHCASNMDHIVGSFVQTFEQMTNKRPKFEAHGGTMTEDLALQNIQARSRMVYAYEIAQLLPWIRRGKKGGFLLVLGSANVDESLRGYFTKYDCSSADLNPIGGISKTDLKLFLEWAGKTFSWTSLLEVVRAAPTAELRPQKAEEVGRHDASGREIEHAQTDEEEMGMTYDELSVFGRLRKIEKLGPYSMMCKLLALWGPGTSRSLKVADIATKVKRFFRYYAINRHKMTTITPSYHAENYSPDDNRYDLRQFLYPVDFTNQFNSIDKVVEDMKGLGPE